MIEIRPAEFPLDLPVVTSLFREYAQSLGIDLSFQHFEVELATLPGKYHAPKGQLLLAWRGEEALGCIALRPISDDTCEMKRLYVRPQARGERLGRRLVEQLCTEASQAGYRRIVLDTLPSMEEAVQLYQSLNFQVTDPYVFNPLPGALFLEKLL